MAETPRRLNPTNAITIISAAILVGTEVFVGAFAGGWAISNLLGLTGWWIYLFQGIGVALATAALVSFVRRANRVEPILER